MENENKVVDSTEMNTVPTKKGKKKIGLMIGLILAVAVVGWCVYNIVVAGKNGQPASDIYSLSMLLVGIFVITALGYLLGRITIKGVSLGTAGVFLVAILFGFLFTLIPNNTPIFGALNPVDYVNPITGKITKSVIPYFKSVIQNVGLVLFVGSVGFIAGPKFFRDLKKNFKTYIVMGIMIILIGTIVTIVFALVSGKGADFWSGVLSGALTSTPGYSAAIDAIGESNAGMVTIGHAIAYPFGVVGVVLFVQLLPKMLKSDMAYERSLLKVDALEENTKKAKKTFKIDDFGFAAFAIAIIVGLLVGGISIPLTGDGYATDPVTGINALTFSLGTTGGVLIMCLVFGHFGRIGKISMEVPMHSLKTLKELGLMLFLIGAGVDGGAQLVEKVGSDPSLIVWGLLGGAVITMMPMVIGFFFGKKALKLPLLNNLGSITGGMTSTPALGTLIQTADTDDVAGSYASTYPIALVLIVVACNLMIKIMM